MSSAASLRRKRDRWWSATARTPTTPPPTDGHWYGRLFWRLDGSYYRRRLFEAFGSDRYSRPALYGLDVKLAAMLGDNGFFVEAGANDGFTQSNTYLLERRHGWKGVLVEPIPRLARRCAHDRPEATVVQCALVPPAQEGTTVSMRDGFLMSFVVGAQGGHTEDARHVANARQWMGIDDVPLLDVPARTLTSVLAEAGAPQTIDLLSLDLEGFELQALQGLDLERFRPRVLLIEVSEEARLAPLEEHLQPFYESVEWMTPGDRLFRLRDTACQPRHTSGRA